jgi:hypothetical protein
MVQEAFWNVQGGEDWEGVMSWGVDILGRDQDDICRVSGRKRFDGGSWHCRMDAVGSVLYRLDVEDSGASTLSMFSLKG